MAHGVDLGNDKTSPRWFGPPNGPVGSTTREERFPSQRVNQVSILISLAITVLLQGRRTVWRVLPDADKERGNNQEHEEGNGPGETDSSNFLLQDNLENQEAV